MADKRAHASPKCCDLSVCQQHVKKKRRKCERTISKIKSTQNIMDCSKRNVVQYLYVDPVFIEQATCPSSARIRAGGGIGDITSGETFYDCASESDWDENKALVADPLPQRLFQISDVINKIEDPKEFRALLKEVAYTSYILYRSFRKAYGKTKKNNNEHKCEYCREKERRDKGGYDNPEDKDQIEIMPARLNGVGDDGKAKDKLCPICFQPLAEKPASVKSLNPPDYSMTKMKNPESRTRPELPSKNHPGNNEQASQTRKLGKPPNLSKHTIKEQSSQTVSPESTLANPPSTEKSCLCPKGPPEDQSKMVVLKPVSISIPLKLQVESENMKPRFIETQIVLKSFIDQPLSQQLSSPQAQLPANKSSQNPAAAMPQDVVSTSQNSEDTYLPGSSLQAASDIFYSCISSSGIIEPVTKPIPPKGEASLNEVFDIVNKRMQTPTDVSPPPPLPPAAIKPILDSNLAGKLAQMPSVTSQLNDGAKIKLLRDQVLKEVKDTLERSGPEIELKPLPNNLRNDLETMQQQPPVKPTVMPAEDPFEASGPEIALKPHPYSLPNEPQTMQQQQQQPVQPTVMPAKDPIEDSGPEIALKPQPYSLPNESQNIQQPVQPTVMPTEHPLEASGPEIALQPHPDSLPNPIEDSGPEIALKPQPYSILNESQTMQQQQQPVKPTLRPAEDAKAHKPLATSSSLQMVTRKHKPKTNRPKTRASWSHFTESVQEPTGLISETIQTDVTALQTMGHYKRSELRGEIKGDLQELLEPKPIITENKYEADERDDILLDLSILFHPETALTLPKQKNKENTLDDIRYILEPVKTPLAAEASRTSILINIRYILQPKLKRKPAKRIYSKQTREKILEDLHEVLTPKRLKKRNSTRIRDGVLKDLRTMLDANKKIEPNTQQITQPAQPRQDQRLLLVTPQRDRGTTTPKLKKPNEINNSVLADLIYLLDTNEVHPPQQATTSQPVPSTQPAKEHLQITPTSKNETENKPPTASDGSSPDPDLQTKNKVDQAKLNPSSQVVDQTPKGWMDTTKAEGVSLASTLSTVPSSKTFFARLYDTSPENFHHRSTLNDDDRDNGKEVTKSRQQKLVGNQQNYLNRPSRVDRNDLAELSPNPKMLNHATQSPNDYLNRQTAIDIHDSDMTIDNSDLKLESKRNLYRFPSDKVEPKARKSIDVPQESKSRKPKDLSQIMEGSELFSVTSSNSDSDDDSLLHSDNKIKPKTKDADVKEIDLAPRKSYDSKLNLQAGRPSAEGFGKLTDDIIVKPQEIYSDRNRYSELLLEAEKRPSISRYAKPIDDSHVKPQEKPHERTRYSEQLLQNEKRLSQNKYDKPTNISHVKPQEKPHERTRYSEQLLQNDSRLSRSRYGKPTDDSNVKPEEKSHERTRYSEQLLQNEKRLSQNRYDKPTDISHVKPQEKSHDRTRYSEQLLQNESRLSQNRYDKPTDVSNIKPQEKPHDRTRYSEQVLHVESRLSTRRYSKPTDDSNFKPQDKYHESTRYSEQLLQNEKRLSQNRYDKPTDISHVKPQEKSHDRTRYSEQLLQNEKRLSQNRYDKPTDISHVKPQEKSHDRTRYSEQLLQNESRLSRSRVDKPTDVSHVQPQENPHDRTRYSEQLLQNESRLSQNRYDKPTDVSNIKPQEKSHERTRYSEQLLHVESRLSTRGYSKPTDDSNVKPQEKYHDSTRYSEQLLQNDSRLSSSRYDKPTDVSHVKPQEKHHDRTRYSEQLLQNESRLSQNRYDKPTEVSNIKPQEKPHDRTRYSEQVLHVESRLSTRRYSKPTDDSNFKPQDKYHESTRYSEQLLQNESRLSQNRYDKPTDVSHVQPQEKTHDRTRYSEQLLQNESRLSQNRYDKPTDVSHVQPQEKTHDRTRYSEQLLPKESRLSENRYDKPTDVSNIKPQEKSHERTRYSEQLLHVESRLSTRGYSKPTDDSNVKPQEKYHDSTRYSEQLLQNDSRLSRSRYDKPTDVSHVQPQEKSHDRTRYSEQLLPNESRLSENRYDKPTDVSNIKPQEKSHDITRNSELVIEAESIPFIKRYDKPTDDSNVKQQYKHDKTEYSADILQDDSSPSKSSYSKPTDDSQEKSHDKTRYSEPMVEDVSRPSLRQYDKPTDDLYVKQQDKAGYSEQLPQDESRLSGSRYGKPTDHSIVMPQEKSHDKTRYSELVIEAESKSSIRGNDKPKDDSYVKQQDKYQDKTGYSEQLPQDESRLSRSRFGKPTDDSHTKPQEQSHETESKPSLVVYSKPNDDVNFKPQDQYQNTTRHSDFIFETESRSSKTRYVIPSDSKINQRQKPETNDDRTRYSEILIAAESKPSKTRYSMERHSLISNYINNDLGARQSKTYHNRQASIAADNTRDSLYARKPIISLDNLKRSSTQSVSVIKNATPYKIPAEPQDDIFKKPTRKILDESAHSSGVPNKKLETYSPLLNETLPEKNSYVPLDSHSRSPQELGQNIHRQVSQFHDSFDDFSPRSDAEPIMDFDKKQKLPEKILNDNKPSMQSVSKLAASSFAKPSKAIDSQTNLMADRIKTSELQIYGQSGPPTKRDSKVLDRQSYVSVLSDLNITQSNQHTSNKSPYKRKSDLPEDNLIRSRTPNDLDTDNGNTQYQQQPTGHTENAKDISNLAELSPKPKTINHATQSSNEYLNRSYSDDIDKIAPTTKSYSPLKSNTKKPEATVEPKGNLSRLSNESIGMKPRKLFDDQSAPESHLQHDLRQINEPLQTGSAMTSKPEVSEQIKMLDAKSPVETQQQSLPATSSNDSKLIIQHESRPVINRFENPSLTSNRLRDSELIIKTGSRNHSKTESLIFISKPNYTRQPVNQEQTNLPEVILKKLDTPKTFQEPATTKKTPENINKTEDPPFNDEIRFSLPVSPSKREHGILDNKYSTPTIHTNNNNRNQPQGQVLQSEQDNNKPQLSKETVEQQTSPTNGISPKRQLMPNRDSPPNTLDERKDAVKDKPLETPETVGEEKPLIYLYSRPNYNEENKENQQFKGNIQISSKTSISSEFQNRPSVVVTKPEPIANIVSQDDKLPPTNIIESPALIQPTTITVDQSLAQKRDSNYKTAKAMVLNKKNTKVKPSTTPTPAVPIPITTKTFKSPTISVTDFHNKSVNAKTPQLETNITQANVIQIQSKDSNLPQIQGSSPEPVNEGIAIVSKVIRAKKNPEISSASPRKIEETPKTKENETSNKPEFNISKLNRQFEIKQSTSSLIISNPMPTIVTTVDKKAPLEIPDNERFNISPIKPIRTNPINLIPPRTQDHGTSTTSIIAIENKPAHTKKPDPSQESSSSRTADPDSTTNPETPTNQGFVTSITIQSKSSSKR